MNHRHHPKCPFYARANFYNLEAFPVIGGGSAAGQGWPEAHLAPGLSVAYDLHWGQCGGGGTPLTSPLGYC